MATPQPGPTSTTDLKGFLDRYERRLISAALSASRGHQRRAAAALGVKPTTLNEKIKRLGLASVPDEDVDPGPDDAAGSAFVWSGLVKQGYSMEVQGTVGDIQVRAVPGPVARVRVRRSGEDTARRLAVNVLEHEDGVIFSVHQVRASLLDPGPFIRFELAVPADTRLTLRLQSGDIEVIGVRGRVEAHTFNGTVRRCDEPAPASDTPA
jgi:hypothetical protein